MYPGNIYFILAPEAQAIKIGYTTGFAEARLAQLQTGCPEKLHVVLCVDGSPEIEQWIHWILRPYQIRAEWFDVNANVVEFIEGLESVTECLGSVDFLWKLHNQEDRQKFVNDIMEGAA